MHLPALLHHHCSILLLVHHNQCQSFFFQGPLQSISVGEIRLGLRKPLTQLGLTILTQGPVLQLRISELHIVLRQPAKSANKKKPAPRKPTSASSPKPKGNSKGQAKWRLITNVASLLSLSLVDLRLKVPPSCHIFYAVHVCIALQANLF